MANIEWSVAVIPPPVVGIHRCTAIVGVAGHIERVRPRVAAIELKAAEQALVDRDSQVVIIRNQIVGDRSNLPEKLIRTPRIDGAGAGEIRRVVVEAAVKVVGMGAQVLDIQAGGFGQLALHAETPLVHRRRRQMPVIRDPVLRDRRITSGADGVRK